MKDSFKEMYNLINNCTINALLECGLLTAFFSLRLMYPFVNIPSAYYGIQPCSQNIDI